jgi:hypothetical protein
MTILSFPCKLLYLSFLLLGMTLGIGPGDGHAQRIPLALAQQFPSASVMGTSAVDDPGRFFAPFLRRRGQDVGVERKRGSADPIEAESIGSGPAFVAPGSIAVAADGALSVLDAGLRAVFRVDH